MRREQYTGTWLPEPVLADPAPDAAVRAETLSMAVLVLLESLTPVERAVFVLREAFDYGYDEIAEIVGKSEDNCRQLASPRAPARGRAPAALRAVARAARGARAALRRRRCSEGETEPLVELLAADAAFYGDGGGKAPAVGRRWRRRGGRAAARRLRAASAAAAA